MSTLFIIVPLRVNIVNCCHFKCQHCPLLSSQVSRVSIVVTSSVNIVHCCHIKCHYYPLLSLQVSTVSIVVTLSVNIVHCCHIKCQNYLTQTNIKIDFYMFHKAYYMHRGTSGTTICMCVQLTSKLTNNICFIDAHTYINQECCLFVN